MSLIDNAIYVDGMRSARPATLEDTFELLRLDRSLPPYRPTVDEIEDQLFNSEAAVSRRIYELSREVIEFQRATHPLLGIMTALEDGFDKYGVSVELQHRPQDEEVKKISGWAAILFAPTLVGTVYGMNFDHMPELHWAGGYPLALLAMGTTSALLYLVFKRRRWL